jgi:hypothetical protein
VSGNFIGEGMPGKSLSYEPTKQSSIFLHPEGSKWIDTSASQHDNARALRRLMPAGSQS